MDQVMRCKFRALLVGALMATPLVWAQEDKTILVLRPAGSHFEEAEKGLTETLGSGYTFKSVVVDKESKAAVITEAWTAAKPKAAILMDNRSVNLFKEAQSTIHDTTLPVIALMGVRMDLATQTIPNSWALNYEIPAVTSVVNVRSLVSQSVKKIGVVHRASWQGFIEKQASFCAPENIQVVGKALPDAGDPKEALASAIEELQKKDKVDAIWILNDNLFLNATLVKSVWIPLLSKWKGPVIVGVESLVNPALQLGSFAVLPDNYALGGQAAGMLQEIEDAGWKTEEVRVDQPLSVIKVLNARQMKSCCGLQENKLGEVDKVLE